MALHGMQDLPPELVYVRISGYGQTGPKAPLAGGECSLSTHTVCIMAGSLSCCHADSSGDAVGCLRLRERVRGTPIFHM